MSLQKNFDLRLKLGNLALATLLTTVPTSITIGTFTLHGLNVCKNLAASELTLFENNSNNQQKIETLNSQCNKISIKTSLDYIIWIWLIIMLPTWRWFYVGHLRRVTKDSNK